MRGKGFFFFVVIEALHQVDFFFPELLKIPEI